MVEFEAAGVRVERKCVCMKGGSNRLRGDPGYKYDEIQSPVAQILNLTATEVSSTDLNLRLNQSPLICEVGVDSR